MHKILAIAGLATLASLATAQIGIMPKQFGTAPTYAYPASYFAIHNGISGLTWRNTAFRFQMVYDTTVFTGQGVTGPITINRLKFRAADGVVNAGGQVYSLANVYLSSSPSNYAAPSTTFLTNRGTNNTLVYSGAVTIGACTGGAPNDYVIDLLLTTPFVYDPTLGLDLCVEVDAPAPSPATVPSMATSATAAYVDLGSRVSAASQTATTGTASTFASVIWFEFTGPGGTASVSIADNQRYGIGCNIAAESFYELTTDAAMDLGGAPGAENVVYAANAGTLGYSVSSAPSAWYAPTGAPVLSNDAVPVAMGDDTVSQPLTLPFAFPFNGSAGVTTVHACSNGYIILGPSTLLTGDFSPTAAELLTQQARVAPFWADLNAAINVATNPAAGVYFDVDPSGTIAYVTFVDVAEYGAVAGTTSVNFQLALHNNGDMEFRYRTKTATSVNPCIVGFSKGLVGTVNSVDPGSRDISASLPFQTNGPDTFPVDLSVSAYGYLNESRPVAGQNINFVTSGLTPSTAFCMLTLGYLQFDPGIDLGPILSMPGCSLYSSADVVVTVVPTTGTSVTIPIGVPVNPVFYGMHVFFQSWTFSPGANPQNLLTSNGLDVKVGNF